MPERGQEARKQCFLAIFEKIPYCHLLNLTQHGVNMSIETFIEEVGLEGEPPSRQISIRVTYADLTRLDEYAEKFGVTRTSVIADAIVDWLEHADDFMEHESAPGKKGVKK